jgi:hypothetical protein
MNRRREIAKRWHPDAHPNATPEEKERLGRRFAEEMAKLDRDTRRAQTDYEPRKWPSPNDAWWDDLGDDDERQRDWGQQSEIHRRQRAWEAEQERKRAEEAAKAAEAAKEFRRRMQEPVPWHKVLLAPMVAMPLGVTIACLTLFEGSCSDSACMGMMAFMAVLGFYEVQRKRDPDGSKGKAKEQEAAAQRDREARDKSERTRRAQEARAAQQPYNVDDLPFVDRLKRKLLIGAGFVVAGVVAWAILVKISDDAYRERWRNAVYTNAKVVDVRSEESRQSRGGKTTVWINTIEFDGRRGELFGPGYRVGETVPVRYLPGLNYERYSGNVECVRSR